MTHEKTHLKRLLLSTNTDPSKSTIPSPGNSTCNHHAHATPAATLLHHTWTAKPVHLHDTSNHCAGTTTPAPSHLHITGPISPAPSHLLIIFALPLALLTGVGGQDAAQADKVAKALAPPQHFTGRACSVLIMHTCRFISRGRELPNSRFPWAQLPDTNPSSPFLGRSPTHPTHKGCEVAFALVCRLCLSCS